MKKDMDNKYLESAILLARLYGIAETLNPWVYLENEKFISLIKEWADEYQSGDILKFLKSKIESKTE